MQRTKRDAARVGLAAGSLLACLCLTSESRAQGASGVTFDWQPVTDPGNPADVPFTFGAVANKFSIAKSEVTNAHYAAFLNAKASLGGALGIWNPNMASDPRGGITRAGGGTVANPYVFTTRPLMDNKPVNFVNWFDAARFVNWLENGQGSGNTESGAYSLLGANPSMVLRELDTVYFLPTEDEWYKAAYYEPGGPQVGYWGYPTRSNQTPAPVVATSTGDIANPGHVANYLNHADWNGLDGHVTTVGSAGPLAESFYGCANMTGNVREWTETIFMFGSTATRVVRGGSWIEDVAWGHKSNRFSSGPEAQSGWYGFRVARRDSAVGNTYCFGVGCPCGNDDPSAGCRHSGGLGARLFGAGSASVSADDLTFCAGPLPAGVPALLFTGGTELNGGLGLPFGDGLLCAGGVLQRLSVEVASPSSYATWAPGLQAQGGWVAGETRFFQVWYRDTATTCTPSDFNTTHGLRMDFLP